MNFKILLIAFIISSCGLKTKPKPPKASIPSILEQNTLKVEKKEKKKK